LISDSTNVSPKGTIAKLAKANKNVKIGANINKNLLATLGNNVSFNNNFKPSAKGCNKPQIPTIFGPFLFCIAPKTLRSAKVKNAIDNKTGIIINKILINIKIHKNTKDII